MKLKPSSPTRAPLAKDCTWLHGKVIPLLKIPGNLKLISVTLLPFWVHINKSTNSGNCITSSWQSLHDYLLAAIQMSLLYDLFPFTSSFTICHSNLLLCLLCPCLCHPALPLYFDHDQFTLPSCPYIGSTCSLAPSSKTLFFSMSLKRSLLLQFPTLFPTLAITPPAPHPLTLVSSIFVTTTLPWHPVVTILTLPPLILNTQTPCCHHCHLLSSLLGFLDQLHLDLIRNPLEISLLDLNLAFNFTLSSSSLLLIFALSLSHLNFVSPCLCLTLSLPCLISISSEPLFYSWTISLFSLWSTPPHGSYLHPRVTSKDLSFIILLISQTCTS